MSGSSDNDAGTRVLCGTCPDPQCKAKLFFPVHDSSIECSSCGQRHNRKSITDIAEVTNPRVAVHQLLKNVLLGNMRPKKGSDTVKVLGVSNYQCKILSPLLTKYGMDKQTGEAKLLSEMGQGCTFDCSILGDRAFLIEREQINIVGYGRDKTGSATYLKDTLNVIEKYNGRADVLIPIHADGDGHCLVHAVSRALVGRELFWHALRTQLHQHFIKSLPSYKALFKDFIDSSEWTDIVAECAPDYMPEDGEQLGLRNLHLFGLANVLRRPIILLDSLSGLQSSADYSGTFLPGLHEPSACRGKDGSLNKPLCVAWSGGAHNHYIALIGVKGEPLPRLPNWLVPKAWGMPNDCMASYIERDLEGAVVISGDKCLQERYVLRLMSAMETVFSQTHKVSTSLVADFHQYVFKASGMISISPDTVIECTQNALAANKLYRCLTCDVIIEWNVDPKTLRAGGLFYRIAHKTHGQLSRDKLYQFPMQGLVCSFDPIANTLVPEMDQSIPAECEWCHGGGVVRRVNANGTPVYINGDKTPTRTTVSKCHCGFKHYWDGKEYDNIPEQFTISLEWNGQVIGEKVTWFQYESDLSLNSNVYEVAERLVQKHFPGEFGSERLVQKVVATILLQTAKREPPESGGIGEESEAMKVDLPSADNPLQQAVPQKIIITGQQSKSVHKEELYKSETEKKVKSAIETNAALHQKRKTEQSHNKAQSFDQKQSHKNQKPTSDDKKIEPKEAKTTSQNQTSDKDTLPCSTENLSMDTSPIQSKPSSESQSSNTTVKTDKIRVTTSDGLQLQLELTDPLTFKGLQSRLEKETGVPASRHKYRLGFPPKPLTAPENVEEIIDLHHGDRLMVEILPDSSNQLPKKLAQPGQQPFKIYGAEETPWSSSSDSHPSWSGFTPDVRDPSNADILPEDIHNSDNIDTTISGLLIVAKLLGRDTWAHFQTMPHLFSVGGLFYQQVARDCGLRDNLYCTIPAIPGKLFRYSAVHDRLELCLEPHGQFAIEPGIEDKVLKKSLVQEAASNGSLRALGLGGARVVTDPKMKYPGHTPFSGQGHSLRSTSETRMPHDLEPTSHHHGHDGRKAHKAARLGSQLSQGSVTESIEEENDVAMEIDPVDTHSEATFQRVGPGCTVLQREGETLSNSFRQLSQSLENYMNYWEKLEEVEEEISDISNNTASTSRSVLTNQDVTTKTVETASEKKELMETRDKIEPSELSEQNTDCPLTVNDCDTEKEQVMEDTKETEKSEPCVSDSGSALMLNDGDVVSDTKAT